MGFVHLMHFLAKRFPKQSAQYGCSSRDVNFSPASPRWQLVQVKQSLWWGVPLYVMPPLLITYKEQYIKLIHLLIHTKPLHNRHIVSVHFNHFYCMGICNKLSRRARICFYLPLSSFTLIFNYIDLLFNIQLKWYIISMHNAHILRYNSHDMSQVMINHLVDSHVPEACISHDLTVMDVSFRGIAVCQCWSYL